MSINTSSSLLRTFSRVDVISSPSGTSWLIEKWSCKIRTLPSLIREILTANLGITIITPSVPIGVLQQHISSAITHFGAVFRWSYSLSDSAYWKFLVAAHFPSGVCIEVGFAKWIEICVSFRKTSSLTAHIVVACLTFHVENSTRLSETDTSID